MPTYTENHALLVWGGEGYSGQEEWSNSTRLKHLGGDAGPAMQDEIEATLDDVVAAVQAYVTRPQSGYAGNITLNWVRLNVISAATGRYLYPNNPIIRELETPVTTPGASSLPQAAYCVTLRSGLRRGPASKGRWYVPCTLPSPIVTSTGVMSATRAQELANSAGTFLSDLANIDSGAGPDAWSPWLYGSGEAGDVDAAVQTASVGNVYDTQRRRRESLLETYYEATTYDPVG